MSEGLYYSLCGSDTGRPWNRDDEPRAPGGGRQSAVCRMHRGGDRADAVARQLIGDALLWICPGRDVAGLAGAWRVAMIAMPQAVGLLNGLGGAASASGVCRADRRATDRPFRGSAATVALVVEPRHRSLVAAGKLQRLLPQQPVRGRARQLITLVSLLCALALAALIPALDGAWEMATALGCAAVSAALGAAFAVGVGGADMPIAISLLNSLSGVAGSIAGMAVSDPLLVAVGGVVGASGLLLTRIMCHALNRPLAGILAGGTAATARENGEAPRTEPEDAPGSEQEEAPGRGPGEAAALLAEARFVIIVPGYGMSAVPSAAAGPRAGRPPGAGRPRVLYAIHR